MSKGRREKPITRGTHKLGNSKAEKYLGNQISQEGTLASITETLDKREKGLKEEIKTIMHLAEHSSL